MKLEPVVRQSLVDVVVERIRTLIDRNSLSAGDRLPGEMELVEQLQVSRPVLREAISRLESVGLVTVRRGQGTFVGDRGSLSSCVKLVQSAMAISPKDLLQFADLRAAIEIHAARLATERATPEDIAELQTLLEQIDTEGIDHLEAIRNDFDFHRKIVEVTRNELMKNVMQVIHEFVMAGMFHTTSKPRNHAASQKLHSAILDAIRSGDPDAAEETMRTHMDGVTARLREAEERRAQRTPATTR